VKPWVVIVPNVINNDGTCDWRVVFESDDPEWAASYAEKLRVEGIDALLAKVEEEDGEKVIQ
jgi:hypothetical protein